MRPQVAASKLCVVENGGCRREQGIIGYMYSNFGTFDINKALFINNIKNLFEKE
jgi:hypothetical protein